MRAATIRETGDRDRGASRPGAGAGEVLVRVRAAGLNGADMMQRRGLYPAPPGSPQDIPGMEFAGEVAALGPGAGRFELGARVMAIVGGGAQAELATVHERLLMPVPDGARLGRRGWPAGGLHDRARRAVHTGGAALGRAPARARRRRRRGHRGDPARRAAGARVTATRAQRGSQREAGRGARRAR